MTGFSAFVLLLACGQPADALPTSGRLELLTYNVHGLPPEITGDDTAARQVLIAPLLGEYTLVGLQEDFIEDNHAVLAQANDHPWKSWFDDTLDGRVYGSGLAVFSRAEVVEHAEVHYDSCYGVLEGASDCLASKGFQRVRLRLGEGEVDVYNTHMEAGNNPEDDEARVVQVQQLIDAIEGVSVGHPVVLLGDTNLGGDDPEDVVFLEQLVQATGLVDACDALGCPEPGRIDRFLVRSRGGLTLTPALWSVEEQFVDDAGAALSDHDAIALSLDWSVDGAVDP